MFTPVKVAELKQIRKDKNAEIRECRNRITELKQELRMMTGSTRPWAVLELRKERYAEANAPETWEYDSWRTFSSGVGAVKHILKSGREARQCLVNFCTLEHYGANYLKLCEALKLEDKSIQAVRAAKGDDDYVSEEFSGEETEEA